MGDLGKGPDVQRVRVGTVHRVAGTEHSAVKFLYGPAHSVITI
jgi:hypothetical protein